MKKDIPELKVEDLALAIVPPEFDSEDVFWDVYLVNLKYAPLTGVVVASRGYGEDEDGFSRKTATFRHFFEKIDPRNSQKIETVPTNLFWLSHEFWISFTYNGQMYDKKYVFVAGSLEFTNFTNVPLLDRRGVMLK